MSQQTAPIWNIPKPVILGEWFIDDTNRIRALGIYSTVIGLGGTTLSETTIIVNKDGIMGNTMDISS